MFRKNQYLGGMVTLSSRSLAAEEEPVLQEVNRQELLLPPGGMMLEGEAWEGHSPLAGRPNLTHQEVGAQTRVRSGWSCSQRSDREQKPDDRQVQMEEDLEPVPEWLDPNHLDSSMRLTTAKRRELDKRLYEHIERGGAHLLNFASCLKPIVLSSLPSSTECKWGKLRQQARYQLTDPVGGGGTLPPEYGCCSFRP